jgi:GT2 family glycosyltransferase
VFNALETIDGEIIVIDNNPDDSCAMMEKRFPNVKLIRNQDNVGFPKGNNIGVGHKENIFASSTLIPLLPKIRSLKF